MILTRAELEELTGKSRSAAQARVLTHMGIPHRRRPDGSVVVIRAHVEQPAAMLAPRAPQLRLG